MKYRDNMTEDEKRILMAEVDALEKSYDDMVVEPFNDDALEDWTDKEYRMLRP